MPSADMDSVEIRRAAEALNNGGLIAYPTEGVWGLGCDPADQLAVDRLLKLKDRAMEKGLILLADQGFRLEPFVSDLPEESELVSSSGRPITWILQHGGPCPDWISGGRPWVAVRVTNHPVVCALCREAKMPLVSTSANPAGKPAAMSVEQVSAYFKDLIDVIVPGELGGENGASEIRDYASGKVLRAGNT